MSIIVRVSWTESKRIRLHDSSHANLVVFYVEKLVDLLESLLEEREMPPSVAAHVCGKLAFTLSWTFGRVAGGRAYSRCSARTPLVSRRELLRRSATSRACCPPSHRTRSA